MPRPIWKGNISFGLVSIPVVLYSTGSNFDIHFKLFDKRDKSSIHYMRVNDKTNKEVPWDKIIRGYEYDKDQFVFLTEDELKSIAGENSKNIDIEGFVLANSLDPIYLDKSYYLVPEKKGEKGYVILREVLKEGKKIGIAKLIIHTKEYVAALMPHGEALLLFLLHYDKEIKKQSDFELPKESMSAYKISPNEMNIAKKLVASMTVKFKPEKYIDEYQSALHNWVEEKIKTQRPHTKMKERPHAVSGNVVNFADLLKRSLKNKKHRKSTTEKRKHVHH